MNYLRSFLLFVSLCLLLNFPLFANHTTGKKDKGALNYHNFQLLNDKVDLKTVKLPNPELKKLFYQDEQKVPAVVSGDEVPSKQQNLLNKGSKVQFDIDSLPGALWGVTYYDFQTNSCMPERVAYFTDGTEHYLQMFWMADDIDENWSRRGTYFEIAALNNFNMPEPQGLWSSRIEGNIRTGWPSMMQFSNGAVGTAAHDPTPGAGKIVFSRNQVFGDAFTTTIVKDNRALWPRNAVDGQGNIHLIYTYDTANVQKQGEIAYTRSTNGGLTWSDEILLTGPDAFDGATTSGRGGDVYALTARGNTVVVAYTDEYFNLLYRKSSDGGNTWSRPTLILRPGYTYTILEDLGGGRVRFRTDTAFTPGTQCDVIIDSQGRAHFVVGLIGTAVTGTGTMVGDIITNWEEDTQILSFIYYALGLVYQYENSGKPAVIFGNPQGSGTSAYPEKTTRISRRYGYSNSMYPQLGVDSQDNIYCVYSGLVIDDTKPVQVRLSDGTIDTYNGLFGHLYLTWRPNSDVLDWSEPANISPRGADCVFPTMCNNVVEYGGKKWMFIAYSANGTPGDRVTTETLPVELDYVMIASVPTDVLNAPTTGVEGEEACEKSLMMNVIPNPITDKATITISNLSRDKYIALELYDYMGRKIQTLYSGFANLEEVSFTLDGTKLGQGMYFVKLNAGNQSLTKILTIVR